VTTPPDYRRNSTNGVERVGDAWSMLILREAELGRTRFDEFQKSLGIAPNILTRRLGALTEAGLFEKRRYSERPPRDEYVLTWCGRDYLPVLHALAAWGQRHFGEDRPTATRSDNGHAELTIQETRGVCLALLIDPSNGTRIDPVVIDRTTGRPLGEIAMRLVRAEEPE
jgi:DNA-binding HxlR family transcriptional regulator